MSCPTLKSAAEAALDRGFHIFPLHPKKKEPATAHGLLDASYSPKKVEQWWSDQPEANIGINAGASGLCVLDFDNLDEVPAWINKIKTLKVKTSRGLHVYFSGVCPSKRMYADGKHIGELKSEGGYILAAGSVHPNGPTYDILDDSPVAEVPEQISELLKQPDKSPVSLAGEKIPYGSHDTELTRIAGRLRNDGIEEEAIYNAIVEVCEKRCENYGDDYQKMCRKIAHSICNYAPGTSGPNALLRGKDLETGIQVAPAPTTTTADPKNWRDHFKKVGELQDGGVQMLVAGLLPEGICFLGALAGQGKTLVALSLAKALTTGQPMFGHFGVPKKQPVLYLIPESSAQAFKGRLKKFGIPDDDKMFLCRTLSEGSTLRLNDTMVMEAVKEMKPVVILDTFVRFSQAEDENSSRQNQQLVDDMIRLRQLGAPAIVAIHHAVKTSRNEQMSLENSLRGSGDIGASGDAVYGIRRDEQLYDSGNGPLELEVVCVKPRDFEPPLPFRIVATYRNELGELVSNIDESGDFAVVDKEVAVATEVSKIVSIVERDPKISLRTMAEELRCSKDRVARNLDRLGYEKRNSLWTHKTVLDPAWKAA